MNTLSTPVMGAAKTIFFEDRGQELLALDIDEAGLILETRPAAVTEFTRVYDPATIDSGSYVTVAGRQGAFVLEYPVLMVRNHGR